MVEKLAQAGVVGDTHPPPYKVVGYAPAERADTFLLFLLYPLCELCSQRDCG